MAGKKGGEGGGGGGERCNRATRHKMFLFCSIWWSRRRKVCVITQAGCIMSGKRNRRPVRNASAKADNGISWLAVTWALTAIVTRSHGQARWCRVAPGIVHMPLCVSVARGRLSLSSSYPDYFRAHPIQRFFSNVRSASNNIRRTVALPLSTPPLQIDTSVRAYSIYLEYILRIRFFSIDSVRIFYINKQRKP